MIATETTTKYEGSFRWGRQGEANIPVTLTRNSHGWFCDSLNGQEWAYGGPLDPFGGWGAQVAKRTALEAVRGFLKAWDANGDEEGCCTTADKLTVRPVKDEDS